MNAPLTAPQVQMQRRVPFRATRPDSLEGERALVIGGYGVGNLGDEAILAGLIQEHDLWDATVVSYDPAFTTRMHGVASVSPFSAPFIQELRCARRIVIGGGGMFSAYMGRFQRLLPLFGLAAQALGKRVEYRAIGAYPGTPPLVSRALAVAMGRADVVSARDASTLAFLRGIGVQRPVMRVPDPALALAPAPRARVHELLAQHAPRLRGPYVAFGVRRLKDAAAQRRLELALGAVARELERAGVEALFIPFSRHPYEPLEDDEVLARELVAGLGAGHVLQGTHHPRDVLGVVEQAEAMVAVRFHALVFAVRTATPVVALPYDAKCSDLLIEAGLPAPLPRDWTALSLAGALGRILDGRTPGLPPAEPAAPADPAQALDDGVDALVAQGVPR